MKSGIFWAVLLWAISLNAIAALHKWVDADGKIHYSDSAPPDVKTKKIKSSPAAQSETSNNDGTVQKSIAERNQEWKKSQQDKEKAEQKAAQEKEIDEQKKRNCENARSNLANLENSPAIVTYNAQGERTFMDDASKNNKMDEARKAISSYCN